MKGKAHRASLAEVALDHDTEHPLLATSTSSASDAGRIQAGGSGTPDRVASSLDVPTGAGGSVIASSDQTGPEEVGPERAVHLRGTISVPHSIEIPQQRIYQAGRLGFHADLAARGHIGGGALASAVALRQQILHDLPSGFSEVQAGAGRDGAVSS